MKHSKDIIFFDQDVLNKLLQNEVLFLSEVYNFIPTAQNEITKDLKTEPAIIHFAGPKPWNFYSSNYDWLYWKYLSKTPWGDTVGKLLKWQKNLGIDLGYALCVGKVASRKMLLRGILLYFGIN